MTRSLVLPLTLLALIGCDEAKSGDESTSGGAEPIAIFETKPDVGACVAGSLTAEYQTRILDRVNQIRLHHELPPVQFASSEAAHAQAAALVAAANAKLTHSISPTAFCYSDEAAKSSEESLLFLSAGNQIGDVRDPDRFLVDWLRDVDVASLGHRRWLLDPFVSEVAFGFVQGEPKVDFPYSPIVGAALHVVDQQDVDRTWWPNDFVAYPFGVYPARFMDGKWLFSFTVVADKSKRLGSVDRVKLDSAKVSVTDTTGAALVVSGVAAQYDLTGVPNVLTWRADGLKDGVLYTVKIEAVEVDSEVRSYEYGFLLMP